MRAAVFTLGCKVNQCETGEMQAALAQAGFLLVGFECEADVYIINTCAVTGTAEAKSRQAIRKARSKNTEALIVAAGCYPQAGSEADFFSDVDIVLGNREKKEIAELIKKALLTREKVRSVSDIRAAKVCEKGAAAEEGRVRAFLKIQDGCDNFCSYCIIPYLRGRSRSREKKELLSEFSELAQAYPEVVITGIEIASYEDGGNDLISLLQGFSDIGGGKTRIRLGSLEPRVITPVFVEGLKSVKGLCPHFHISLQSGCDRILKAMNRRYKTGDFAAACELLRGAFLNPAITTDIIVGFPGETEEEFKETCEFTRRMSFSRIHVFPYSARQGTPAAGYKDQIQKAVKSSRAAVLAEIGRLSAQEYARSLIGGYESVLFESEADGMAEGYTGTYVRARAPFFEGMLFKTLDVKITAAEKEKLLCEEGALNG